MFNAHKFTNRGDGTQTVAVDEEYVERVLKLVEQIPVGRVLPYGRIAQHLQAGYGPRYVGRIMALHGHGVPWWRVPRADGTLPAPLMGEAQMHWVEESTPVRNGRVDMRHAVWDVDT